MSMQEKIEKAFDLNSGNSSLVHLSNKDANTFIDYIVDQSTVLKQCRVERMEKENETIAKVGIGMDVLYPGTMGQELSSNNYTKATTGSIQLQAKEVLGVVQVFDRELRNNIEGDAFKDHLMRMVTKKAANQLERSGLYGRKLATPTSTDTMYDGWISRIQSGGNVVDAANTSLFADRFLDVNKMASLYKSIPEPFVNMQDALYMSGQLMVDYSTLYAQSANTVDKRGFADIAFTKAPGLRTTRPVVVSAGISTTTTAGTIANAINNTITVASAAGIIAGKKLVLSIGTANEQVVTVLSVASLVVTLTAPVSIDVLNSATVKECTLDGADVLITPKDNLIRGIQTAITIEPSRKAELRATNFVITMNCDFQVEETTASGLLYNLKVK